MPSFTLALLLGACTDITANPDIFDESDYFPLDGSTRRWEFSAAEGGMDWTLRVERGNIASEDGADLVTVGLVDADSDADLWLVRWSKDPIKGVRILGYTDLEKGEETTFTIPVVFLQRTPQREPVVTRTDLGTFTSTVSYDGCETFWEPSWGQERCLVVDLDGDGSGDHDILTGQYRLVPSVGFAWLDLDAWPDAWWLSHYEWVI